MIERWLCAPELNAYYARTLELVPTARNPFVAAIQATGVSYQVSDEDMQRIPTSGPLLVVSNHPFGGLDGVVMAAALLEVRQDLRLMVNYLLNYLEPMRPWWINVDPFGGKQAKQSNLGGMRASLKWLREGHCLAAWPAGTVSHLDWRSRIVTDPPWTPHIAGLVRRTQATVLPVYFAGRNSNLFQFAGLLHPRLRTALLARELHAMEGSTLSMRIGQPIPAARLEKFEKDSDLMEFLRIKTYILQNRGQNRVRKRFFPLPKLSRKHVAVTADPLAAGEDPAVMAAEISALPPSALLVEMRELAVYVAAAEEIPAVMRELGRLRELTFRAVGEGTGLARDIDSFDAHYLHLFMWDRSNSQVVGAYRMGLTDRILGPIGPKGLYTTTLFRYRPGVLQHLSPAIEMGRSFIRPEYQRRHTSLSLLWRAIGEFIAKNPRYRILFGPVSISKDYHALSKDLLVQFMKESTRQADLAAYVRAKRPPRPRLLSRSDKKRLRAAIKDIDDISALISEIETDRKGVPVLMRQYLKLNATIISFNLDPDFSDVIDGLVIVDLLKTDEKILRRFMGDKGQADFHAYHALQEEFRAGRTPLPPRGGMFARRFKGSPASAPTKA